MDLRHPYWQGQDTNQSRKWDAHSTVAWHTVERIRSRWKYPWSNLAKIRQIDWLECLRGGLMQLKGTLGLCNLPALHPWAQLGLTRSRLFTDKVVILVCGGHFILWNIASGVSKAAVKTVLRECEECQSIDLAPVHWSKRALKVKPFFDGDRLWPCSVCHLATSSSTRCDKCNQPTEGALLWAGSANRDFDR